MLRRHLTLPDLSAVSELHWPVRLIMPIACRTSYPENLPSPWQLQNLHHVRGYLCGQSPCSADHPTDALDNCRSMLANLNGRAELAESGSSGGKAVNGAGFKATGKPSSRFGPSAFNQNEGFVMHARLASWYIGLILHYFDTTAASSSTTRLKPGSSLLRATRSRAG